MLNRPKVPNEASDDGSSSEKSKLPKKISDDGSNNGKSKLPKKASDDGSNNGKSKKVSDDGSSSEKSKLPKKVSDDGSSSGKSKLPKKASDDGSNNGKPKKASDDGSNSGNPKKASDDGSSSGKSKKASDDGSNNGKPKLPKKASDDGSSSGKPKKISDDGSNNGKPKLPKKVSNDNMMDLCDSDIVMVDAPKKRTDRSKYISDINSDDKPRVPRKRPSSPTNYEIISFCPNDKKRIIAIHNSPKPNSKVIGFVIYGDNIEIHEKDISGWNKIKCNDTTGYIKIEYGVAPQVSDDSTMYIGDNKKASRFGFIDKLFGVYWRPE